MQLLSSTTTRPSEPGTKSPRTEPASLVGADLAGVDLAGVELHDLSLAGANLAGADLTRARLTRVDLSLANLRGARLEGASLEMVTVVGATLAGARGRHARFEHVNLSSADLSGVDLTRTLFKACSLERTRLDGCDLTGSYLIYSCCNDASFRGAELERLAAVGSSFAWADFAAAKRFLRTREVIHELARRVVAGPDDFDFARTVAAVLLDRGRCYPDWKRFFDDKPEQLERALRLFAEYPESGCSEALAAGLPIDADA